MVATRGALDFDPTRRTIANNSAILRSRAELFEDDGTLKADARHPHLFSTFLDLSRRPPGSEEMMFSVQLAVSMITYTGEDTLTDKHYVPGEYLFRDTVVISAIPPADKDASWQVGYVLADSGWSSAKMAPQSGRRTRRDSRMSQSPWRTKGVQGDVALIRLALGVARPRPCLHPGRFRHPDQAWIFVKRPAFSWPFLVGR